MSDVTPLLSTAEIDDLDELYIGPAYRAMAYADAYESSRPRAVVEGPPNLTAQFIEQRFEYYKTYWDDAFRQFVALDGTAKPPFPLLFGVCTVETESDDILEHIQAIYPNVTTLYFNED